MNSVNLQNLPHRLVGLSGSILLHGDQKDIVFE